MLWFFIVYAIISSANTSFAPIENSHKMLQFQQKRIFFPSYFHSSSSINSHQLQKSTDLFLFVEIENERIIGAVTHSHRKSVCLFLKLCALVSAFSVVLLSAFFYYRFKSFSICSVAFWMHRICALIQCIEIRNKWKENQTNAIREKWSN